VSSWICPSCGSAATTRYCGNCGERRLDDLPVVTDAAATRAQPSFLGRLRASLTGLISPPGRITSDWIRGRRVRYLTPLSLFLWINVAFFLIQSISGLGILTWPLRVHLGDDLIGWLTTWLFARLGHDPAAITSGYAELFNALEAVHAKSLVIVMVPPFAATIAVLILDRREPFQHSWTFALHFFAFSLLWLCAIFPVAAIVLRTLAVSGFGPVDHRAMDLAVTTVEVGGFAWYLYRASGTVFGLRPLRRLVTVIALIAALNYILKAYHVVVFAVTLYATPAS
jgi:hypothetical protein